MTLADAIRTAVATLSGVSDSPRLDAELLLCKAAGLERTTLLAFPERTLPPADAERFATLVARRVGGEPIAYILEERNFWTFALKVTPAVLIPRPETELVVERALAHLPPDTTASVLDLAAGSGAIALAIANERPQARVVATDLSTDALQVARDNIVRTGLDHVHLRQGNWYQPVVGERFALIASNPPYIAADDIDLAPDVRAHEPTEALIAGFTGLEALKLVISGAPVHLEPGGWLILEHGWRQAQVVRILLAEAGFSRICSHADPAGHERVTEGQWTVTGGR